MLILAVDFGDEGAIAEGVELDEGECAGIEFDVSRLEKAGRRRVGLGVLSLTFCSEGRLCDDGFGRTETLLLNGGVERIAVSMGVDWRVIKGRLNRSEKNTVREENQPCSTLCIFQILVAFLVTVYTFTGV
jgi:hypothetical protein